MGIQKVALIMEAGVKTLLTGSFAVNIILGLSMSILWQTVNSL